LYPLAFCLCLHQGGQQQTRKNPYDGNHNQQLHHREGLSVPLSPHLFAHPHQPMFDLFAPPAFCV
jgi:hypothetical protein